MASSLEAYLQEHGEYRIEREEGGNGIFDVFADGKRIYTKRDTGRFPEHAEILEILSQ